MPEEQPDEAEGETTSTEEEATSTEDMDCSRFIEAMGEWESFNYEESNERVEMEESGGDSFLPWR